MSDTGLSETESEIKNWIERQKAEQQKSLANRQNRNLSLRLPMEVHVKLARITKELLDSKHSVAQKIFTKSIDEIYAVLNLPEVTPDDIKDFVEK